MKACDKYPPATPDDVARVEANCHQGKVHPLLWVVLVVLIIIGVGVYSDVVGFYEFEEIEEIIEGEEDEDKPEVLDESNWGKALPADKRKAKRGEGGAAKPAKAQDEGDDDDEDGGEGDAKDATETQSAPQVQPDPTAPVVEELIDGEIEVIEEEIREEQRLDDQADE